MHTVLRASAWVLAAAALSSAATLEKLALDQMIQKSTDIVRGRIVSSSTIRRGAIIYTVATVAVAERWKGPDKSSMQVALPGGSYGEVKQMFSGVPVLSVGTEYALFLWTGPSGMTQIVGLSQGMLDLKLNSLGQTVVERGAITGELVDPKSRIAVPDDPMQITLSELRARIQKTLAAAKE